MTEFIEIDPYYINSREIQRLTEGLRNGKLAIIPTDSIYAIVGDLNHRMVVDNLAKAINEKSKKAHFSILCKDLKNLSVYTTQIDNATYKLMNRLLPGPYTFILKASNEVPKIFRENKKTIGIRVPDNTITQAIIAELENPLVSTSLHSEDAIQQYLTDPMEIYEMWQHKVDYIIDGGIGKNEGTTVLEVDSNGVNLIREGLGIAEISFY